jgi:hypothetical protein
MGMGAVAAEAPLGAVGVSCDPTAFTVGDVGPLLDPMIPMILRTPASTACSSELTIWDIIETTEVWSRIHGDLRRG